MCRQPLFSKDVADAADVAGVTFPARASPELCITQVDNAFRASGMGDDMRTLHDDIEWSYENLRVLAPFAQHMLAGTLSVQEPGAVRIDLSLVGSGLTLMANVLPQIASEEHNLRRQWSEADSVIWKEMMTIIWRVIAPSAGLYLDREALYHALVAALFDNVLSSLGRFNQRSVFFGEAEFIWDLTFLLHFVTGYVGDFKELPVPESVEVHFLPRTGSRLALECADGWADVTFGEEYARRSQVRGQDMAAATADFSVVSKPFSTQKDSRSG
jgi:hypothetical protein